MLVPFHVMAIQQAIHYRKLQSLLRITFPEKVFSLLYVFSWFYSESVDWNYMCEVLRTGFGASFMKWIDLPGLH